MVETPNEGLNSTMRLALSDRASKEQNLPGSRSKGIYNYLNLCAIPDRGMRSRPVSNFEYRTYALKRNLVVLSVGKEAGILILLLLSWLSA